jgi:hypothetical protein
MISFLPFNFSGALSPYSFAFLFLDPIPNPYRTI